MKEFKEGAMKAKYFKSLPLKLFSQVGILKLLLYVTEHFDEAKTCQDITALHFLFCNILTRTVHLLL